MPMQRYKLVIAYDGTAYCGWQRQPDPIVTVQRAVEIAAGSILGHPVTCRGSSRTDTGVHAMGQVAQLDADTHLDPDRLRRAINSRLPEDILIRHAEFAPAGFSVHNPCRKRYRYLIWSHRDRPLFGRQYLFHFYHRLDVEKMQHACQHYVGTHDFASFKGKLDDRESSVRTIYHCNITRRRGSDDPLLIFSVEGNGFLYHMVRTMVGTILEIGRTHRAPRRDPSAPPPPSTLWTPDSIPQIIAAKNRAAAGVCLPPQGLCLQWIKFDPAPAVQTPSATPGDSFPSPAENAG